MTDNPEKKRLEEHRLGQCDWKKWGPYLSERQWGTVREDYSPGGTAWEYLPHDHARSRAYRWGEDGLAGICDDHQVLCFALALWNGKDPILKERLFGLTGNEGNHGEDVKEQYFYLDATPTHSYMKMLYKYPQGEFPYARLVEENGKRSRMDPEFELQDSGAFENGRYFDVFVEYAKAGPEDILIRLTVHNRSSQDAVLHLIPQLWFRNRWSWQPSMARPLIRREGYQQLLAEHPDLGSRCLYFEGEPEALFCDNETNVGRLWGMEAKGPFKDAFHDYVIAGHKGVVSGESRGTKAGLHHALVVPAQKSLSFRFRLAQAGLQRPFESFDKDFSMRVEEADAFYAELQTGLADPDARSVQRQALSGMLWSKQFYDYDVRYWLEGDPGQPAPPRERLQGRNHDWLHLNNSAVISMPDTWEYPWYAAWDLAFHSVTLCRVDPEFAKGQLLLLIKDWYMHPNGQLPAYEWAFGDVNPPVHAWAAWETFEADRKATGREDLLFLEKIFQKLLLNFTWWVNRKDAQGNNIFEGGFLGLDNIGVFDRSEALPTGGFLEQADGTSWMAMYCLNMMRIALKLALTRPAYEDMATKFFEHFLFIAKAMTTVGGGLWNDEDGFFYDVLHGSDGKTVPLKIHSLVGLVPLLAVETLEQADLEKLPAFRGHMEWFLNNRPELASLVSRWHEPGQMDRSLLSLLRGHRIKALLKRMLDEKEFLSDHGIRALSKIHQDQPYEFDACGTRFFVNYEPGESESGTFGGNSNWRGPIWMPMNYFLIQSLKRFHHYYGDDFKVECPTGSGKFMNLSEVAGELSRRVASIFLKGTSGLRPVFSQYPALQKDPLFNEHVLFYEYFHGDSGRGCGASHQTGWTGLIALLLQP